MARTSAFQAEDIGSTPLPRTMTDFYLTLKFTSITYVLRMNEDASGEPWVSQEIDVTDVIETAMEEMNMSEDEAEAWFQRCLWIRLDVERERLGEIAA